MNFMRKDKQKTCVSKTCSNLTKNCADAAIPNSNWKILFMHQWTTQSNLVRCRRACLISQSTLLTRVRPHLTLHYDHVKGHVRPKRVNPHHIYTILMRNLISTQNLTCVVDHKRWMIKMIKLTRKKEGLKASTQEKGRKQGKTAPEKNNGNKSSVNDRHSCVYIYVYIYPLPRYRFFSR